MGLYDRSGSVTKISGTFRPLHDKVFVTDMEFGEEITKSGIVLKSDNGKSEGVRPRWARVWAIGPDQHDVKVGEWILIEHGRWTRTVHYEEPDGNIVDIRMVELDSMIMSADEKPDDAVERRAPVGAGSNVNFNIPGA